MGVVVLIVKQPPSLKLKSTHVRNVCTPSDLLKFYSVHIWSMTRGAQVKTPPLNWIWQLIAWRAAREAPLLTVWQYDLGIFQSALWMQVDRIRMSDRPPVYSSIAVRCWKLLDPTRLTDRQQSGNGCRILDLAFAAWRKSSVRFSTAGGS